VVTGAASGIGRAIADGLAAAGWNVSYVDRDPVSPAPGPDRSLVLRCDVTDEAGVREVFAATRERFAAPAWACFANAGVSGGSDGFVEVELDRFRAVVEANLTGCFLTMREAARAMQERGGRIVATSSVAGIRGSYATGTPYAAAKAGIINMVQQAAIRLAGRGITVNAICPGPVETNAGGGAMHDPSVAATLAANVPLGRVGQPAELVPLALMFAGPESAFITGQVVAVDGGMSAFSGRPPEPR
jgi:NAD(P)-dependent dehydrogenase (short-subunit alcohol dehydrogenase family)